VSRILRRPMFKRGGTPNTGIMDGFGEDRVMAQSGLALMPQGFTAAEDEVVPTMTPSPTATTPVFTDTLDDTRRQAPDEPLFGLSDYASLFKLGANIASAPGRGTGLGGVLAAAGPSLAQAADEFAASQEAKAARRREFDTAEQARLDTIAAGRADRDFQVYQSGVDHSRTIEVEGIKHKNNMDQFQAELVGGKYTTDYKRLLDERQAQRQNMLDAISAGDRTAYDEAAQAFDNTFPEELEIRKDMIIELKEEDKYDIYENRAKSQIASENPNLEKGSPEYKAAVAERAQELYFEELDKFAPEPIKPAFEGSAEAEKRKEGEGPMTSQLSPPPQGFAEGGQAMGMQGGDQSPELSFEELRARLPMEVTDQVVRLLATSEAALLDFANIDTQEDIAIFNQKYNVDLQLPVQVA